MMDAVHGARLDTGILLDGLDEGRNQSILSILEDLDRHVVMLLVT